VWSGQVLRLAMVLQAAKNAVDKPVEPALEYNVDQCQIEEAIAIMDYINREKRQLMGITGVAEKMDLDSMFNEKDIMADPKRQLVRLFKMKETELITRDFANNGLVPVQGKATAEQAKNFIKWLVHLGFGIMKQGKQRRSVVFKRHDKNKLSQACLDVINRKLTKK